ncbi:hypothetical protein GCM10009823_15020 [Brevibacterium salitolerans]|uniref:Uncharacterized protein n=1 Tax=Brevibacterium salitolerans TaxID=1403566 RepID=A0ABP5I8X5_9MICO
MLKARRVREAAAFVALTTAPRGDPRVASVTHSGNSNGPRRGISGMVCLTFQNSDAAHTCGADLEKDV